MIQRQKNNNLTVLPFYMDIDEQNHRRTYAYGEKYPLYTPIGSVPTFQIIRNHNSATVTDVMLHKADGHFFDDVTYKMQQAGLTIKSYASDGYDIIMYPTTTPRDITTEEGQYYLVISMSDSTVYYSDIFTVVADMGGFLRLEWWDIEDLIMDGCRIAYTDGYKNVLWLNTQLGKPDYEFEEEGENRDGRFFPEKMISQKRYKCVFLASEYLCDVMRFIRLSDYVNVRDRYGNLYLCDTFLCTPKWQEQGDLASMEVEFTCDTVAKKIGRGYTGLGDYGDFNSDYNNDYNNEQQT